MFRKISCMIIVLLLFSQMGFSGSYEVVELSSSRNFIRENVHINVITQNMSISNFNLKEVIVDNDEDVMVVLYNTSIEVLKHVGAGKMSLILDDTSMIKLAKLSNVNVITNAENISTIEVLSSGTLLDEDVETLLFSNDAKFVTFDTITTSSATKASHQVTIKHREDIVSESKEVLDNLEEKDAPFNEVTISSIAIVEDSTRVGEADFRVVVEEEGSLIVALVEEGVVNSIDELMEYRSLNPEKAMQIDLHKGTNDITIGHLEPGKEYEVVGYIKNDESVSDLVSVNISACDYDLGSGTDTDPFKIYRVDELLKIGREWSLDSHYKLMRNLTLDDDESYLSDTLVTNWVPIGTKDEGFTGVFDGNGYTISNLIIDRVESDDVGLFSSVDRGTVKNLGLKNVIVHGRDNVGSIAGYSNNGRFMNVYISGEVTGRNVVGGVCGLAENNVSYLNVLTDTNIYSNEHSSSICGRGHITAYYQFVKSKVNSINDCGGVCNEVRGVIIGSIVDVVLTGKNSRRIANPSSINPFLMSNYALEDCIMPDDWVGDIGTFSLDGETITREEVKNENSTCYMGWDFNDDSNNDGGFFTIESNKLLLWYTDGANSRQIGEVSLD